MHNHITLEPQKPLNHCLQNPYYIITVCLHMTSRIYEIDIGCIVVNEIDVILKLLTWARKYNILFDKNKTILLLFKSFFVEVFTFVSMLAFHIRV